MSCYRINRWAEIYENNRSRVVKDLRWVAVPNRFDGEKYSELMLETNAAELFSAWILVLEVASRCQPRGSLVRDDGTPHTSRSLSLKTHAPQAWFDSALAYFTRTGWLKSETSAVQSHGTGLTPACHPPAENPSDKGGKGGERIEGKERKVATSTPLLAAPAPQELALELNGDIPGDREVVLLFPCIGKDRTWPLLQSHIDELQLTYPGINSAREAREAWQWCTDNPGKRKTHDCMRRFLNTWMKKSQTEQKHDYRNGTPKTRTVPDDLGERF